MVRATRRILSWARAERPSSLTRVAEQVLAVVGELAELADLAAGHLAVVAGAAGGEAGGLDFAGGDDLLAHAALLDVPARSSESSLKGTAGTSMWMSMRSSSGPLILAMYRSICGTVQWHSRRGSLR